MSYIDRFERAFSAPAGVSHTVTFGERLRKEREKRNITLDDVSLTTKIGTRMLRALEDEKFDQLPGGIFNKGFVRAYARYLSIDEDQAVADYLEAAGEAPPAAQGRNSPPKREASETFEPVMDDGRSRSFPWGTIAAFILAVAIGLTIWRHNTAQEQAPAPSPSASQNQQTIQTQPSTEAQPSGQAHPSTPARTPITTAPVAAGAPPASSSAQSSTRNGPSSPLIQPPGQASNTRPATTANPVATAPPPAANSAIESAAVPPGSFAVLITADDDSWISIAADGRILFQGTLVAPAQRLVHAQQAITIRAGNVGALDFAFNGKKLPTQGDTGEVKTLSFGAGGLQPPAPKPPSQ
jgi:cytoskeleton protein RodZ